MSPLRFSPRQEELRRTQSRLTWTTIPHILPNQSLHSLAQARCCLERLQCLATRQTRILFLTWDLNIALLIVYRSISQFRLIRRMCRLINRLLPSVSNRSHGMVVQGTHQLSVPVIHRIQDAEPNMGIPLSVDGVF